MNFNNNPCRNVWRPEDDALLRKNFGVMEDADLAALLGRTVSSLSGRANRIRFKKEYNRSHASRRAGLQDITATAAPYGPAPIPALGATARAIIANSAMRGSYTCPELRPFDGRPGAMDAFALPSRRFDKRVWRDGRVEGVA